VRFTAWIPVAVKRKVKTAADSGDESISAFVTRALRAELERVHRTP
jgi:hypothetical protein